jgi:hypothetical protein
MCVSAKMPSPPPAPALPPPPPPSPLAIPDQLAPVPGADHRNKQRVSITSLRRDLTIPTSGSNGLNIPT